MSGINSDASSLNDDLVIKGFTKDVACRALNKTEELRGHSRYKG